jgi:hypothetical protein
VPTKPSDNPNPEVSQPYPQIDPNQGTLWPDPAPDPDPERGETHPWHLLPDPDRIRSLDFPVLAELVELVRDWDGPLVDAFRLAAAERLADQ